jgi:hypothetical protein
MGTERKYYYKYQKEKKLNSNTTRMANVSVWDFNDKLIGNATVSKWQKVEDVVDMLVRDYEVSKVWNSKEFSFNR